MLSNRCIQNNNAIIEYLTFLLFCLCQNGMRLMLCGIPKDCFSFRFSWYKNHLTKTNNRQSNILNTLNSIIQNQRQLLSPTNIPHVNRTILQISAPQEINNNLPGFRVLYIAALHTTGVLEEFAFALARNQRMIQIQYRCFVAKSS